MSTPVATLPASAPAPALRRPARPQTPILPADSYCPGRIRQAADAEAGAVAAFTHEHPEYGNLPLAVVQQVMNSTARQGAAAVELRHDEGIPDDWRTRREDEGGPRLSEEG